MAESVISTIGCFIAAVFLVELLGWLLVDDDSEDEREGDQ